MSGTRAAAVVLLLFVGAVVGRCGVEPEVVAGPAPPPEVITKTETVYETVYEDKRIEVPVEVETLPPRCRAALDSATLAYEHLSDYDATVGRIDRLLEEMNLGILGSDVNEIVEAETELRKTHNDSQAISQSLADTKVTLERDIRLCNKELKE